MDNYQEREKREIERRKESDRRKGEIDKIYKSLVSREVIQDTRKDERRRAERRTGEFTLSEEEKYVIYLVGIKKINLERKKAGLEALPGQSLKEWLAK